MEKYVLITGGSAGIGKALAKEFASHNYNVAIVGTNEEKLNNAKKEIENKYNVKVESVKADLRLDETPVMIYNQLKEKGIEVEILVNNAGLGDSGDYSKSNWSKTKSIIEVNNMALVHMVRVFSPEMLERGHGRILNIASNAGFMPLAPQPIYGASKAFVISFSQALYDDYKEKGVTVTVVNPGPTKTDFFKTAGFELKNLEGVTPEEFASFAYKKLMQGKAFATHGFKNKAMSVGSRLFPRAMVRKIARKVAASK